MACKFIAGENAGENGFRGKQHYFKNMACKFCEDSM